MTTFRIPIHRRSPPVLSSRAFRRMNRRRQLGYPGLGSCCSYCHSAGLHRAAAPTKLVIPQLKMRAPGQFPQHHRPSAPDSPISAKRPLLDLGRGQINRRARSEFARLQRILRYRSAPQGAVAQLGERRTGSAEVWGSIPHSSTKLDWCNGCDCCLEVSVVVFLSGVCCGGATNRRAIIASSTPRCERRTRMNFALPASPPRLWRRLHLVSWTRKLSPLRGSTTTSGRYATTRDRLPKFPPKVYEEGQLCP